MAEFEIRMEALRQRFVARTRGDAKLIIAYAKVDDRNTLRDLCHAIAGTAGMFRFSALGDAASAVENAIDTHAANPLLESLVTQLLSEIERLPPRY
jgi:HPt (histidine-containing phosphotransfer) domain-containing protein